MTAEAVAREMLRAFNTGDWEAFRATIADDFAYREHGTSREAVGADAAVEMIAPWKVVLGADHTGELVAMMADGDRVALQLVWRGRHVAPMPGPDGAPIPPTGVDVATPACMVMTVRDDRITEMDHYFDSLVLMLSIGGVAVPAHA
ncbi:MAG: ester cyclase [Thermoleophilia bacterium]